MLSVLCVDVVFCEQIVLANEFLKRRCFIQLNRLFLHGCYIREKSSSDRLQSTSTNSQSVILLDIRRIDSFSNACMYCML